MDYAFAIAAAIIGIIINIVLSKLLPQLLVEQPEESLLGEVGTMFKHHDKTLVSSSATVAAAVFLSVIATQFVQDSKFIPDLLPPPYSEN